MRRIFVAIPIKEELQGEISIWAQNFKFSNFAPASASSFAKATEDRKATAGQGKASSDFQQISPQSSDGVARRMTVPNFKPDTTNPVRWIKGKNLHVTLVPPFAEASGGLRPLIEKLEKIKCEPFEIRFNRITFGPNLREPRLVWAGGESLGEIEDLRYKIYDILKQKPENRPFRLHLTLARFRAEDFKHFKVKSLDERVDWRQKVNSFVLMESHLSPQGADYEVLDGIRINTDTANG